MAPTDTPSPGRGGDLRVEQVDVGEGPASAPRYAWWRERWPFFRPVALPAEIAVALAHEGLARARVISPVIAAVMVIFVFVDQVTVAGVGSEFALDAGWPLFWVRLVALVSLLGWGLRSRRAAPTPATAGLLLREHALFFGLLLAEVGALFGLYDWFQPSAGYYMAAVLFAAVLCVVPTPWATLVFTLGLGGVLMPLALHPGGVNLGMILNLVATSILGLAVNRITFILRVEAKVQNEQFRAGRVAAERANQAKDEFLANMSHELRTPMNGILGLVELLREEPLSPSGKAYVEKIHRSGGALLALLNDILDLSKIEASKLELERVPLNLPALLDDVVAMMRIQAEKRGVRLFLTTSEPLPVVAGDPVRIRQLLLNLVGNAIKFTEEGEIVLDVREIDHEGDATWLRYSVSDSGIGIAEDKLDLLFRSFHQVDASTARKYGGTGLGLAISKHLVRLMGGEIGVQSRLGEGSEFWFVLPMQDSTPSVAVARREAPSESSVKGEPPAALDPTSRRLLVADDNEINREVTVAFLERLGFRSIDTASDGSEALARLARSPYDLILLDIQMPKIDGLEIASRLRASPCGHNARTPLIATTAGAMKGNEERCLRAGMSDYLSKPFTREELADKVVRWLSPSADVPLADEKADVER